MLLTETQIDLIATIDKKVKDILANNGNDEKILVELFEQMPSVHMLITTAHNKTLDMYLQEYEGFYYYMKLLENMAQGIADSTIKGSLSEKFCIALKNALIMRSDEIKRNLK